MSDRGSVQPLSPIRPLDASCSVEGFDCGERELNEWLRRRALVNHLQGHTKTHVVCRGDDVVAFYAIAPGSAIRDDAPRSVGHEGPRSIPVVLLARLGVDVREQGQGLGAALLKDAIQRASVAAKSVGGRALLVHAKHDRARSFYEHFGFEPSPTDPLQMFILLDGVIP